MLVSRWCYQSGPSKVIVSKAFMVLAARLMLSLSSVIGRFQSIYYKSDQSVRSLFDGFIFDLVKSFVRHQYSLTSVKRPAAFQS